MSLSAHYAKTPKGIEEMTGRQHSLGQRARQVLILLDGTRTTTDIAKLLPDFDVTAIVAQLTEEGFIAPLQETAPTVQAASVSAIPEGQSTPSSEAERFALAQRFMTNTVAHFLGFVGSGLSDKIAAAQSLSELRALYYDWREALNLASEARSRMKELEGNLAALLS